MKRILRHKHISIFKALQSIRIFLILSSIKPNKLCVFLFYMQSSLGFFIEVRILKMLMS